MIRRQSPGFVASKPEPVIKPSCLILHFYIKITQLLECISKLLLLRFSCLSSMLFYSVKSQLQRFFGFLAVTFRTILGRETLEDRTHQTLTM